MDLNRLFVAIGLLGGSFSQLIAQQLPTLVPSDYGQWETLGRGTLAPDGAWLAVLEARHVLLRRVKLLTRVLVITGSLHDSATGRAYVSGTTEQSHMTNDEFAGLVRPCSPG